MSQSLPAVAWGGGTRDHDQELAATSAGADRARSERSRRQSPSALLLRLGLCLSLLIAPTSSAKAADWPRSAYSEIRSVTYYNFAPHTRVSPADEPEDLASMLPRMRAAGFNTVWLINTWADLQPHPLTAPGAFDEANVALLRRKLAALRAQGMRAIIPLGYFGPGWQPEGIGESAMIPDEFRGHSCDLSDAESVDHQAFERYVAGLLARIIDYADDVYIMFYTEETIPCDMMTWVRRVVDPDSGQISWKRLSAAELGRPNPLRSYDGREHARRLQQTLGSLPARLPIALRERFAFGFHDDWIVTREMGGGLSPVPIDGAGMTPFDFMSFTFYGFEVPRDPRATNDVFADRSPEGFIEEWSLQGYTDAHIRHIFDERVARFRELLPRMPLILGETGGISCPLIGDWATDANQRRIVSIKLRRARLHGLGYSLWQWRNFGTCGYGSGFEYSLLDERGRARRALHEVTRLIETPDITGVELGCSGYGCLEITGRNLTEDVTIDLYTHDHQTIGFLPPTRREHRLDARGEAREHLILDLTPALVEQIAEGVHVRLTNQRSHRWSRALSLGRDFIGQPHIRDLSLGCGDAGCLNVTAQGLHPDATIDLYDERGGLIGFYAPTSRRTSRAKGGDAGELVLMLDEAARAGLQRSRLMVRVTNQSSHRWSPPRLIGLDSIYEPRIETMSRCADTPDCVEVSGRNIRDDVTLDLYDDAWELVGVARPVAVFEGSVDGERTVRFALPHGLPSPSQLRARVTNQDVSHWSEVVRLAPVVEHVNSPAAVAKPLPRSAILLPRHEESNDWIEVHVGDVVRLDARDYRPAGGERIVSHLWQGQGITRSQEHRRIVYLAFESGGPSVVSIQFEDDEGAIDFALLRFIVIPRARTSASLPRRP